MRRNRNLFNRVGAVRPRRNVFNLDYRIAGTCEMGQLIPVMCDEVVPGDTFKIGNELVIRFQPLVAPILHEVYAYVHYFYVPLRIMWDDWEKFIVQGEYGEALDYKLPVFNPSSSSPAPYAVGKLWDYLGFPMPLSGAPVPPTPEMRPNDFPWRAYNMVYNEYYRDQDLQDEVDLLNNEVLPRNWRKDYFTAARPRQQKGTPPALPVETALEYLGLGDSAADYTPNVFSNGNPLNLQVGGSFGSHSISPIAPGASPCGYMVNASANSQIPPSSTLSTDTTAVGKRIIAETQATSTTFNVSDLRLSFQIQKWLERNMRAGTRYTEYLSAHFGVSPRDDRLDRPEYIGGTRVPIIISEVLQTSQTDEATDNPLGQFAGHGVAAESQFCGSCFCPEFGVIIGIMSIMPKRAYQQGINRQWLRREPTDFYSPEFAHLSEQGIYQGEIYFDLHKYDPTQPFNYRTFGFTGQYDEMRTKHDLVVSEFRNLSQFGFADLSFWHLADYFSSAPNLNSNFISCIPRKDIFAVPSKPGIIFNCQNRITAVRPLPLIAEPGLVDHF